MTTASVLLTVSAWNCNADKCEKEVHGRAGWSTAAVAARELRETPATREQALRIMREWLQQNKDVVNVRLDESFLLRFLRQRKFSILMAQQTLLKYLNLRKIYPECFLRLDCEDAKVKQLLNDGYIMVSPVRDSKGRRVIIYSINRYDPTKYTCWEQARAHAIVYESCLEDPVDQVCGFTHVGDGTGASAAQVLSWNPTDFGRLIKWGEQSIPMRQKECHVINIPTAVRYVLDLCINVLPPKLSERVKIHTSLKSLHKHTDPACLPTTAFGGTIPTQDMVQSTRQLLTAQRNNLLLLDEMDILSTRGIMSSRGKNKSSADVVEGSFRKLEID